ncbi:MAG: molybdenum cofactor guanylyltransferase [Alphaproteobacteria bacterium]
MQPIHGIVIAGGEGRRLANKDTDPHAPSKPFRQLNGKFLIRHVIDKITPQVDLLAINGSDPALSEFDLPLLSDLTDERRGPLEGLFAGLSALPSPALLLTVPTDTPFLPDNLVSILQQALTQTDAAAAITRSHNKDHPTVGLWRPEVLDALEDQLEAGHYSFMRFIDKIGAVRVDFGDDEPDPFFNINTPDDLAKAETLL